MKQDLAMQAGCAAAAMAMLAGVSTLLMPTAAHAGRLQDTLLSSPGAEANVRSRLFFKLSYIHIKVKTTSKDAQDVTGPVLARDAFGRYLFNTGFVSSFQARDLAGNLASFETFYDPSSIDLAASIDPKYDQQANSTGCESIRLGLGTPCGVKVKSDTTLGTPALSLGYFLDEQLQWAAEAFVLAAPIKAEIYGDGDNQLRGRKIIDTTLLPPVVTVGRYFGQPGAGLRPYVGLGLSYAVFFDTRATATLNGYQGGSSEGDTTVRIGNTWGFGPFMGLSYGGGDSGWQWGMSIGKLRYKPETALTTRNTRFTHDSVVLKDYGGYVSGALVGADGTYRVTDPNKAITVKATGTPEGFTAGQAVHVVTAVLCDLARAKNGSTDCNQGTFARKASTTLDNTLFMLSVSKRF